VERNEEQDAAAAGRKNLGAHAHRLRRHPLPPRATTAKERYRFRQRSYKRYLKVLEKIKRRVKQLHFALAKWLCENHDLIILPWFGVKGMVEAEDRRIPVSVVRKMLTWSHGKFRERLLFKVRGYPTCRVHICTEEYTTRTCGLCTTDNPHVGGGEVFHCIDVVGCGAVMDRDEHAARNIVIKVGTESEVAIRALLAEVD
jgi:putative transposase